MPVTKFKSEIVEEEEGDSLNSDAQIVIDIGYLKDIDQSPQNIKELSRLMGD